MSDIKLLISIDEEDYKKLTKYGEPLPCGNLFDDGIMKAVANGQIIEKVFDKSAMMSEIYMKGVNMTGEYQGCWVRFKNIEKIVNKYIEGIKNEKI